MKLHFRIEALMLIAVTMALAIAISTHAEIPDSFLNTSAHGSSPPPYTEPEGGAEEIRTQFVLWGFSMATVRWSGAFGQKEQRHDAYVIDLEADGTNDMVIDERGKVLMHDPSLKSKYGIDDGEKIIKETFEHTLGEEEDTSGEGDGESPPYPNNNPEYNAALAESLEDYFSTAYPDVTVSVTDDRREILLDGPNGQQHIITDANWQVVESTVPGILVGYALSNPAISRPEFWLTGYTDASYKVRAIPVYDENGKPVGVLGEDGEIAAWPFAAEPLSPTCDTLPDAQECENAVVPPTAAPPQTKFALPNTKATQLDDGSWRVQSPYGEGVLSADGKTLTVTTKEGSTTYEDKEAYVLKTAMDKKGKKEYGVCPAGDCRAAATGTAFEAGVLYNDKNGNGKQDKDEKTVARVAKNGRIESNFNKDGKPTTVILPEYGNTYFNIKYDKKGNVVSMEGYEEVNGQRRLKYIFPEGDENSGEKWIYNYDEKGKLVNILGIPGCALMTGCTFDELKQLKEKQCRKGGNTETCTAAEKALDNLKADFWDKWAALRKGVGAGQGYCGILDMMGVSCGDSLFPAFDDFMQNTVIGNVLSGETSALCTIWTDNPTEGGSVALGPGGVAGAWIAGEYIDFNEPVEGNESLPSGAPKITNRQQYIAKVTFAVTPSGMVDGKCENQKVEFRVEIDGEPVDLDMDGTAENDAVELQCSKGGYSATGRNAVVRYLNQKPDRACLVFDSGKLNSLFKNALDGGKLCNRIVPVERSGNDYSCSFCLFGDRGFVQGEIPEIPTGAEGENGEVPQRRAEERRPLIRNPA